ncbi:MAG: hypothetical protein L6R40_003072 [Gallowayella cf. fulva]|nr:MAG: hypothetical protein L6R40_003072 [Xanthomendoza cf. fulva]
MKPLLQAGTDVNASMADGITALHLAAFLQKEEAVRIPFHAAANIEAKTHWGFTALHLAAAVECEAVVRLLLESGSDAGVVATSCDLGDDRADEMEVWDLGDPVLLTGAQFPSKAIRHLPFDLVGKGKTERNVRHPLTAKQLAASGGHGAAEQLLTEQLDNPSTTQLSI